MALEEILEELAESRLAFRARRANIDEELRNLRAEKLAAEQAAIEQIIVKAMAQGATLGQVKRAYGTKDHRTIADIVTNRAAEIQAVRDAREAATKAERDWFRFNAAGDQVIVTIAGHTATFSWVVVDGEIMFSTAQSLWNDDYTIRNEAVALLDGKTEADSEEARTIVRAINGEA